MHSLSEGEKVLVGRPDRFHVCASGPKKTKTKTKQRDPGRLDIRYTTYGPRILTYSPVTPRCIMPYAGILKKRTTERVGRERASVISVSATR